MEDKVKCNTYCPSVTSSICCAREEQRRQELRTRCERGRHFEFAPPDKLNDSPAELQVVRFCAVREHGWRGIRCDGGAIMFMYPPFLWGRPDIAVSSSSSRRRPPPKPFSPSSVGSTAAAAPPSSIRLTGLTHTHSFPPSFPRRLSWQKMVICGLATERAVRHVRQVTARHSARSGGRRDEVALSKRRRSSRL